MQYFSTMKKYIPLLALLMFVVNLHAQQRVRDHRSDIVHWKLWADIQNRGMGWPINPQKLYRLSVGNGQLAYDAQSGSVRLLNTSLNISIERAVSDPDYGDAPNTGAYVRLNEPVAIHVRRGNYLIYTRENRTGLGWQERSQFSLPNAPDVYQWEFRSLPSSHRDHRTREITTGESLALYNISANKYLVYDRSQNRIRFWNRDEF